MSPIKGKKLVAIGPCLAIWVDDPDYQKDEAEHDADPKREPLEKKRKHRMFGRREAKLRTVQK